MRSDVRKACIAALTSLGINLDDRERKITLQEVGELQRILKEEYDIEVNIKQFDEFEELRTSMKEFVLDKKPTMEICGTPPDGKERRRERRRLERLQKRGRR